MKYQFCISAVLIGLLFSSCGGSGGKSLTNEADSLSYAIGVDLSQQLAGGPQKFDLEIIAQAIKDTKDGQPKMTAQDALMFLQIYQQREMQKQMGQTVDQNAQQNYEEKNKAAGENFLEENKRKEGVVTLPSGLQYKITKQGTGVKPKATDNVEVYYKGTLIDGTIFDSNEGQAPISFGLNQVIRGWTEGLQHINEGSKVTFYIPQELAYGANPRPGGPIEPCMALVFDIELLKVIPGAE